MHVFLRQAVAQSFPLPVLSASSISDNVTVRLGHLSHPGLDNLSALSWAEEYLIPSKEFFSL